MFEIARLQNALLHSVPLHEYKRLRRNLRRLCVEGALNAPDTGYYSAEDPAADEDDHLVMIDITRSAGHVHRVMGES
jgi:hypothetical protein